MTGRTVYYYRSRGILSPCAMIGSQLKFTERHVLEMKAALALQATADRPTLGDIANTVQGMTDDQLLSTCRSALPRLHVLSELAESGSTRASYEVSDASRPAKCKTIRVDQSVALLVSDTIDSRMLAGLIKTVQKYLKDNAKEETR